MDNILLAKILAALEWQNFNTHNDYICDYISYRHLEILKDTQNEFNYLSLEGVI